MVSLTPEMLKAQITTLRRKSPEARAFALRTPGEWAGPESLPVEDVLHRITVCRSDLQAREALRGSSPHQPVVLLFDRSKLDLGEDVLARVAKRRLLDPVPQEMLAELFQVRSIDPRILTDAAMVEALASRASDMRGVATASGSLDLDRAWAVLLGQPSLLEQSPDLSTPIAWSATDADWDAIESLPEALRPGFFRWLEERGGPTIRFLEKSLEAGHGRSWLPLGLIAGMVFPDSEETTPAMEKAVVRLEPFIGGESLDGYVARSWAHAAARALLGLKDEARRAMLRRTDDLIRELKIEELANLSAFTELGFIARMEAFGNALDALARSSEGATLEGLVRAFQTVQAHDLAKEHGPRLDRATMAVRLTAWWVKRQSPSDPPSLPAAAEAYLREGGYVDWARLALHGGDSCAAVARAYERLLGVVNPLRSAESGRFAQLVADWYAQGSPQEKDLIAIEDVAQRVLAPVVGDTPALMVVLDGMSAAVFSELMEDLVTAGKWVEITSDSPALPRPVLAALPSVTEISRKALFAGQLCATSTATEAVLFRDQPALLDALKGHKRPVLFQKGDLQESGGTGLSAAVRSAVSDAGQRLVAVVLNAIDDQLSGSDQLYVSWKPDHIPFLDALLALASEANRAVVLISDHGHILDRHSRKVAGEAAGGGNDRYRRSVAPAQEGEVSVAGSRLKAAIGEPSLVCAVDETIRYTNQRKGGYHGGASPQELVVPLAILMACPNEGGRWSSCAPRTPAWWFADRGFDVAPVSESTAPRPVVKTPKKAKSPKKEPSGPLLPGMGGTAPPTVTKIAWLDALFVSELYKQQAQQVGRVAPREEQVRAALAALDARGGTMLAANLAQALRLPVFRIGGLVASLGRVLNVDGYQAIEMDHASGSVKLNFNILSSQFGIQR